MLFIHLSADGYLGCSHLLAVRNDATRNCAVLFGRHHLNSLLRLGLSPQLGRQSPPLSSKPKSAFPSSSWQLDVGGDPSLAAQTIETACATLSSFQGCGGGSDVLLSEAVGTVQWKTCPHRSLDWEGGDSAVVPAPGISGFHHRFSAFTSLSALLGTLSTNPFSAHISQSQLLLLPTKNPK